MLTAHRIVQAGTSSPSQVESLPAFNRSAPVTFATKATSSMEFYPNPTSIEAISSHSLSMPPDFSEDNGVCEKAVETGHAAPPRTVSYVEVHSNTV